MKFLWQLLIVFFTAANCYALSVGDSYDGGTVFCVSGKDQDIADCNTVGSGEYGLIMANEDQANLEINESNKGITWSKEQSTTNASSNDDGAANTIAIINARPDDDASNNAAYLCRDYKNNTGWYLPSKNELNKMYIYAKAHNLIGKNCSGKQEDGVQCFIGGNSDRYKAYWSSTERFGGEINVWSQYFSNGFQRSYHKNYYFGVRPVRAFNPLTIRQQDIKKLNEETGRLTNELESLLFNFESLLVNKGWSIQ